MPSRMPYAPTSQCYRNVKLVVTLERPGILPFGGSGASNDMAMQPSHLNPAVAPAILTGVSTRDQNKPDIDYPTPWGYRIVGTSEDEIRAHVLELLADVEHELVFARQSSGGRYVSLHLRLVVQDEAQRLAIYEHLVRHAAIRFVV